MVKFGADESQVNHSEYFETSKCLYKLRCESLEMRAFCASFGTNTSDSGEKPDRRSNYRKNFSSVLNGLPSGMFHGGLHV